MGLAPDLLRTVVLSGVGATVGAIVSATVSYLYRRWVRRRATRLEAILRDVEYLLGHTASLQILTPKGTMNTDLRRFKKGFAAGFGVMLIGLLTWAESADLEPVIGPLVPEPFRPLVGVALGGIATIASVVIAKNEPAADESADAPAAPAAAAVPVRTSVSAQAGIAGLVAGVAAGVAVATSPTSVVTLLDPPSVSL
jgi:hypothetical protein